MNESLGDPFVAEEPAPVVRRMLAYGADLLTVATWLWALSITRIAFWMAWSDDRPFGPWGTWFLPTVTFVVLFSIYRAVFTATSGATPGEDLLRLRVVDIRSASKPSWPTAIGRSTFIALVWLVPGWWPGIVLSLLIGASALRDSSRRMFHDHLFGTSVVLRLVPELEPGQSVDEAEAKRRRQFMPNMVNPIQIVGMQMFRHPHLRKDEPDDE